MTTKLTHTIFKSEKISFETNDEDYRYVKANQIINKGELIIIEHCYGTQNSLDIIKLIKNSPNFFNSLYPRKIEWNEKIAIECGSDEIIELCYLKTKKNTFSIDNYKYIGYDISRFNHSNLSNTNISNINCDIGLEVECPIFYMYANRDININEEITINYGSEYFKNNNEFEYNKINNENSTYKIDIKEIVDYAYKYLQEDICKEILFNHTCALYGLYFINDMICPTKEFIDSLTEQEIENNQENIINWIETIQNKCNSYVVNYNKQIEI